MKVEEPGVPWSTIVELALLCVCLGLVVAGVFANWGRGWALIAAGTPFLAIYTLKTVKDLWFTAGARRR